MRPLAMFALASLGWLAAGCASAPPQPAGAPVPAAENWPQFRGRGASGVADGQDLPLSWDAASGDNVLWATPIPGLAHSSPVVWGDRLFVTSAVNSRGEATFKPGLYGSGDAANDRVSHRFVVMALERRTGRVLWERTAHEGVPQDRRHVKATYANSSPATDGRRVVALFGSEGLYAYDADGTPLWHHDLGRLDLGAYDAPDYEWGSASSPVLHDGLVFVQADTQSRSFVRAIDAATGRTVWNVERDEPPSWGTPTVVPGADGDVLVTNASNFIRGYAAATGEELWRLGGSSAITAPTPVYEPGRAIVVASGRRPEKPIFAIHPGARGDISLAGGATANEHVLWSWTRRGPYMPTPLIYDGLLYVLNNDGVLGCYELDGGEEVYRERVPHHGSGFSASPVAADGRLYLAGEDGDVFIVRTGREFELLAVNSVPELVMATPAISRGVLYVRGQHTLYAIGR